MASFGVTGGDSRACGGREVCFLSRATTDQRTSEHTHR
jgi:hypothetical protein